MSEHVALMPSLVIIMQSNGFGWCINMENEDLFGVVYGAGTSVSLEELRAFSWPEIVDQINSGEYTPKICWVMRTQEIPSEHDEDELKRKHLENYQKHVGAILQNLGYEVN